MDKPPLTLLPEHEGDADGGPFDALMQRVSIDSEAAQGWALGYAALDRCERIQIISAVMSGESADSVSGGSALLLLLSVEEDAELAQKIVDALSLTSPDTLGERAHDEGFVWGRWEDGGAILIRGLHGTYLEVIAVHWKDGECELRHEPLLQVSGLPATLIRFGRPHEYETLGVDVATHQVVDVLWKIRRLKGGLPSQLQPLAGLLDSSRH